MDTERMIRNLEKVEEDHKDDKVFTGQLNIADMVRDVRKRLEELKPYEDTDLTPQQIKDMQFCLREKSRECAELRRELQEIKNQKNDRWIPVEERLPEDNKYILLSFSNFELQIVGRYDKDEEGNGAFYIGDCDEQDTCIANDLYVNAWRPLPAPYREE